MAAHSLECRSTACLKEEIDESGVCAKARRESHAHRPHMMRVSPITRIRKLFSRNGEKSKMRSILRGGSRELTVRAATHTMPKVRKAAVAEILSARPHCM